MKIVNIIVISTILPLTGCGTMAAFYDAQDPCISTKYSGATPEARAAQMPRWCGATAGRQNVYVKGRITDPIGSPMIYYSK